jgi:hypothetical protein
MQVLMHDGGVVWLAARRLNQGKFNGSLVQQERWVIDVSMVLIKHPTR